MIALRGALRSGGVRKNVHEVIDLFLKAFPGAPIRNVRLANCTISGVAEENVLENVEGLTMDQVRITRR